MAWNILAGAFSRETRCRAKFCNFFHNWSHFMGGSIFLHWLPSRLRIQWIIIRSYELLNIHCISWGTSDAISGIVWCNYGTIHSKMRNKARPICTRSNNEGPLMWCWWRLWHERPLSIMLYMTIHWETLSQLLPWIHLGYIAILLLYKGQGWCYTLRSNRLTQP